MSNPNYDKKLENENDGRGLVVAIPKDGAYCFYCPENIGLLASRGVKMINYKPT